MTWLEDLRPKTLDEVVGQTHIVKRLKALVAQVHEGRHEVPNLFFAGPAGTGKTAAAGAFVRDLFGAAASKNLLVMNASDEGRIEHIRERVNKFAATPPWGYYTRPDGTEVEVPFSVVFLDECDAISDKAQAALRRTMEVHAHQCVFILSCNYPRKVIAPLRDRCAFADTRFRRLNREEVVALFGKVALARGLKIHGDTSEFLDELHLASKGSARRVVELLFDAHLGEPAGSLTVGALREVASTSLAHASLEVFTLAEEGAFGKVDRYLDSLYYDEGMSGAQIIEALLDATLEADEDHEATRARCVSLLEALRDVHLVESDLAFVKAHLRAYGGA